MVKIRLRRVGATKRPMYRIVAADSRAPRDGRFLETLGHYHPLTKPATVVVNQERLDHWLSHGAQPTDVVQRLIKHAAEAAVPATATPETKAPAARTPRRTRAEPKPEEVAPTVEAAADAPVAATETAEPGTPEETS